MKPESPQRFYGGEELEKAPHQFEAVVVGIAMLAATLILVVAAIWQWVAG